MERVNKPSLVQAILKAKKMSIADLVKQMGISRNTFYYQLNKDWPDVNFIMGFNNASGLDLEEILTEANTNVLKSNPRLEARPTRLYADPLDHEDKNQKVIELADGTKALRVTIVPARAYAGYMRGFADLEHYDDLEDILWGVDSDPHGTYLGFEVVGDSMVCLDTMELADASIFPGRIAIGRELPQEHWKTRLHTHNYTNWIFVHKTEGILIKQITKHDVEAGIVTIHSLNPKYPDEDLRLEDMQQIFSVLDVIQRTRRKLK